MLKSYVGQLQLWSRRPNNGQEQDWWSRTDWNSLDPRGTWQDTKHTGKKAAECTFLCRYKALRRVGTGQGGVVVMHWSSTLLGCSEDTQQWNMSSSKRTVTRPVWSKHQLALSPPYMRHMVGVAGMVQKCSGDFLWTGKRLKNVYLGVFEPRVYGRPLADTKEHLFNVC